MAKYKSLIVTTLLSVAALTGAVTTGVVRNRSMASSFEGDGYIVNVAETEEGLTAEPVYFSAGTRYKKTYPDEAVFKDIRGTKYTVDQDSFVHYQDGSLSAMTPGVVLNLDDVNGGLVNTYSFDAGTVLASNGNGYTAENNGASIPFDNFVWKLSDDRYYVYSDDLQVETVNGTMEDMSGGVQVDYLEDGIIRLSSENSAWQGIAAGAKAITGDGAILSFDDKVITDAQGNDRMTLGELLMDADDNIKVQSAQDWVPPEFDFTTIDGENGQIGADGAAGQAGENGENGAAGASGEMGENGVDGEEGETGDDGDDGSDGSSGRNGSAGSNGKLGGDGANGSIPQNQATEQATISLSSFDVDAGEVTGSIRVIDEDGVLEAETGTIKVINESSGQEITALIDGITPAEDMTFAADDEYNFTISNLNADTQYRLVVTSGYSLSDNGSTSGGKKDFVNRTFYTDSTGINLNLEYATTTGFTFTLDKKDYAVLQSAQLMVKDKDGSELFSRNYSLSSGKTEYTVDLKTEAGLTEAKLANSTYTVTMKLSGSGVDKEVTQKWKTLKLKPTLGIPQVNVNSGGYFEISQPIESDPNNALTGYRYEVYQNDKLLKTVTSTSNERVPLYLEAGVIERLQSYTLKTIATYYDNEKTQELESQWSQSFRMDDQGDALVYFVHADETNDMVNGKLIKEGDQYIHQSTIWGTVVIKPKNLDILIDNDSELTVTLESSGNYHRTWTINDKDYPRSNGNILVPIYANGLKADTSYRIFVNGWVNLNPGTEGAHKTKVYLGDYSVTTAAYASNTKISLTRVAGDINASFTARMEMTTESGKPTIENQVLDQLEFCLYQGSSADGMLIGTYVLKDTNRLHNQSAISDQYLNKTKAEEQLTITNADFNISNSALTATSYYLEVHAAYDYTASFYEDGTGGTEATGENLSGFKNELPYTLGGVQLPISNALPSLPQPNDDAVTVTAIQASELRDNSAYSDPGIQDQLVNLDDDTVVGYRLQARLNNDNGYARVIRYFGFKTKELASYDRQSTGTTDPVNWGAEHYDFAYPIQVSEGTGMPPLQVLFLKAPTNATASTYPGLDNSNEEAKYKDTNYIKGVDKTSGGTAYEENLDGYQTVFTGNTEGGLKRGNHYTFGFKVRMQVENTQILYPDEYKQEIVSGTGMLSSQSIGAPRQATTVAMYLKETTGGNGDPYKTIWNLKKVDDVDQAWNDTFTGSDSDSTGSNYTGGLRIVTNDGSTLTPTIAKQSDGSYNLTVETGNGTRRYQFKMYQKYYDDNEGADKTTASGQFLAAQEYAAPGEVALYNDGGTAADGNIAVSGSFPDASNEVTFTLKSSNNALLNRIITAKVELVDRNSDKGGIVYTWRDVHPSGTSGNSRTVTVDLTSAKQFDPTISGTYSFNISVKYADGKYGMPNFDSSTADTVYAAKILDSDYFMNSYYADSTTQGANYAYNSMNQGYLVYGGYKVQKNNTSTANTEADHSLRLQSQFDNAYSINHDLWYDMDLFYGKGGAEWLEGDTKEGNGYKMTFCPIKEQPDMMPVTKLSSGSAGPGETITIGTLKPSISWVRHTPGITSAALEFTTSSYALITAPAAGTRLGTDNDGEAIIADGIKKYIRVRLYELGQDEDIFADVQGRTPAWESVVPLSEGQQTYYLDEEHLPKYFMKDGKLEKNTLYKVVYSTWSDDGKGRVVEDTMLGRQTQNGMANWLLTTIDSIPITDGQAESIIYNSYWKKSVDVSYHIGRVNGFDLTYELRQYKLGDGAKAETENPTILDSWGHDDVMTELLGYTLDPATNTWKKGDITWSLVGDMKETLNLEPGKFMEPGYDYVLVVDAKNGGASVSTKPLYIPISWPVLRKPTGNVSFRISGGTTLYADVSLADPNRIVVADPDDKNAKGKYLIAYREVGSDGAGKWTYRSEHDVNVSVSTPITSDGNELKKTWEVGIFAATDPDNKGNIPMLTAENFNDMTKEEQERYLIASTRKEGLEAWGGSLGMANISLDGGGLSLNLSTSYGLEKITRVEYSLLPLSATEQTDSQISGVVNRTGASLFTTYNPNTLSQYDLLTIPVGVRASSAGNKTVWLITMQLFTDNSNTPIKTYSARIPY